jgi:hypothetical protein
MDKNGHDGQSRCGGSLPQLPLPQLRSFGSGIFFIDLTIYKPVLYYYMILDDLPGGIS